MTDFNLAEIDTSEEEIVLKEWLLHEYYFEDQQFLEHYTWHKAVYVNSDKAIEGHNKQYISEIATVEDLTEKARVIKPSGEIVELDRDDVETYENEEEGTSYRYFAVEGIEKGSVIEVLIQQTRTPRHKGTRVFFQSDVPNYNRKLEMVAPYHLYYAFRSYNGLPEIETDTLYEEKNHYFLSRDTIPALSEDDQGAYNANQQFLIHKLDRNSASNKNDFTSYGEVAQSMYAGVYSDLPKKVEKKLRSIIKEAKLNMSRNEEDRVRTLETYVKEHFRVVEAQAPILKDLDFITENSLFSEWGAGYLMANLLKLLEIEHELVITSDRFDLRFDRKFEAHIFLNDLLIYIPGIDMYMAPGAPLLRTGILPSKNAGNHGLFISEVKVGDFSSAIGQIRKLPETYYKDNQHNLDIEVDMTEDMFVPKIHIRTEISGYYAQYAQPVYQYLNEDKQDELLENQLEYIDGEGEFTNIVASNSRSYNFGKKPMIIEADLETGTFSESVGNNVLFRIGMLIGPQMEMYREEKEERQIDIETAYARNYDRVIRLTFPEGYELSGLESLALNHVHKDEDGNELGFISTYGIQENVLTVTVSEYYKNQRYPKELFEVYREVINAAADFNKATVVLKKI